MGTVVVLTVLIAIVGGIIYSQIRKKKAGKSSCGCGCENCASNGMCHH